MSTDTPMMQQYKAIKAEYPDTLLMYRMGDFYEMFFDDALTAAGVLGITLTRRRTAKEGDEGIPMCGVPFHAAEGYIAILVEEGYKVALCEQTESPAEAKKRGGKALVKREVTRLYTKGTLTEDAMLKADESNYILSLSSPLPGRITLAYADISTGECGFKSFNEDMLSTELSQFLPSEILIPSALESTLKPYQSGFKFLLTVHDFYFDDMAATDALKAAYHTDALFSLGLDKKTDTSTFGALVGYATSTNVGIPPQLNPPHKAVNAEGLKMDGPTRDTLELMRTQKGEKKGSVFHTINKTVSAAGGRTLAAWLQNPLSEVEPIQARQRAIGWLIENPNMLDDIRAHLTSTCDIARALTRLSLGRSGPRDLDMFQKTLSTLPALHDALKTAPKDVTLIHKMRPHMTGFADLQNTLKNALHEENLPLLARDGGFVKKGYCTELDRYTDLAEGGLTLIRNLEEEQKTLTGIPTLKIKYNKVWGYFIEVSKGQTDKVPENYIHRQTTTNAQRFSLPELMTLERDLAGAETEASRRELDIFTELSEKVLAHTAELSQLAHSLGTLDALTSGALLARDNHYTCPLMDNSRAFNIEGGRHVVVEQSVKNFIANDTTLTDGKLWLITGPNMAGKSTFLRQNALITLLAHMGMYVPAAKAHIGVVDRIFTRLGSGDDLAHGQSTFMVEMVETASIMNNATDKSLILLDEIGRGTATYDGLSIAWACVEHLVTKVKARGLFATHYHELTTLTDTYPDIENHSVSVKEWKDTITFLYKVVAGRAPRSYGIHVAKLAGMPSTLTTRAEKILNKLESGNGTGKNLSPADLPLFESTPEPVAAEPTLVETQILSLALDELTPKQAHDILYNLKEAVKQ